MKLIVKARMDEAAVMQTTVGIRVFRNPENLACSLTMTICGLDYRAKEKSQEVTDTIGEANYYIGSVYQL